MRDEAAGSLRALNEVIERLRAPGGCPWDREQTHASLRPHLLEEAYELLEAIDAGEPAALREELGDVLLQVLMHCAIAAEAEDGFDVGDVAETTRAKMVHRHPHVFADVDVDGADAVVVNWERLKRTEKDHRLSLLDGIPRVLPALAFAQGVQKRPARLGFDETGTAEEAVAVLRSAVDAVAGAAAAAPAAGAPALEEAIGDMLFSAVGLARRLRVNAEDALRARTLRFEERFRALEAVVRADGADIHDLERAEWRRRWEDAAARR